MTVVNGKSLLELSPIENMIDRKERCHGVSYGLSECGLDIRVRQTIRFVPPDPFHFLGASGVASNKGDSTWDHATALEAFHGYVEVDGLRSPGRFTLASSIEQFTMPDCLVGIVHDKSTWARMGLSVFNTVIESGWSGGLTLELVHHGMQELVIPAGAGIAQVVFSRIEEPAAYNGKYQHQSAEPTAAIFEQ